MIGMTDALRDELLAWIGAMNIGRILPGCVRGVGVSADHLIVCHPDPARG
jgi:hypothetical protein